MRAGCVFRSTLVAVTAYEFRRIQTQATRIDRFEAVFQEQWPRVYAILLRLTGDRAEAEDLALEAFWRLYRRDPRPEDNLPAWLFRVATNLGLNALRSRQRLTAYETRAGQLSFEYDQPDDPATQVEREEQLRLVRDALASIKPQYARLLVLKHSGLSYAELAETLDVKPGSVGTLLARAEAEFEKTYRRIEGGA